MVMPSLSISAPCKPHIGSDLAVRTFFAAIPIRNVLLSQRSTASCQLCQSSVGDAKRFSRYKRGTKRAEHQWIVFCAFCASLRPFEIKLLSRFLRDRLLFQFHFALRTGATFL
jgi:hypothetical protein